MSLSCFYLRAMLPTWIWHFNFDSLPKATWSVTFGLKPCLYVHKEWVYQPWLLLKTIDVRALAVNFAFIYLLLQLFSESIYTSFFYTYFCYTISLLLQLYSGSIYTSFFTLTFVILFLLFIKLPLHHHNHYFYTYFCNTYLNYHYIIIILHHHNHYFYTYFCSTISRQKRLTSACHVLTHIPELWPKEWHPKEWHADVLPPLISRYPFLPLHHHNYSPVPPGTMKGVRVESYNYVYNSWFFA